MSRLDESFKGDEIEDRGEDGISGESKSNVLHRVYTSFLVRRESYRVKRS